MTLKCFHKDIIHFNFLQEGDINITSQNKNNRCFFVDTMIYFSISSIWQGAWSNRVVLYMINYLIYDWLLMFLPYFKFVHYIDPSARARKSFITVSIL